VKKFFKKMLKNMFEERSGGAGSARASDGGLAGGEHGDEGRNE